MTHQLGIHAYFDPHFFALMQAKFKKFMPIYLGPASLVPKANTYSLSPVQSGEYLITRDGEEKIHILRNVCRHQGARLIDDRYDNPSGKCVKGAITCPIHQWTWNLDGSLRGAPEFDSAKLSECRKKLTEIPHVVWGNMLFALPQNYEGRPVPWQEELLKDGPLREKCFLLDGYIIDENSFVHDYDASAIICINAYCSTHHMHPGALATFGSVFDVDTLEWSIGKYHSVQRTQMREFPIRPSVEHARWHALTLRILAAMGNEETKGIFRGVQRGFFYPWLSIEVLPLCTIVTATIATSPSTCRNVVQFFWRPELAKSAELFAEYRECQIAAYRTSMHENTLRIERIGAGLRDMYKNGEYLDTLAYKEEEQGLIAYRKFLDPIDVAYWVPRPR